MNNYKYDYYLASPGFNEQQLTRIQAVESVLTAAKRTYYSPFTHGVKFNLTKDQELDKITMKSVFDENVERIEESKSIIALVGNDDKGTNFEIGVKVGEYLYNPGLLSRRLLLIDDNGRISKCLAAVTQLAKNILSSGCNVYVMNIDKKSTEDYLLLGILYHYEIKVVTWASKVLDSNLMSACSTYAHYQFGGDNNLSEFELLSKLIKSDYDFNGSDFNLSNLKFSKNVE